MIDASLAAAWLLHETEAVPTQRLLTVLTSNPILVPAHWPTELANALRKAVRTGRLGRSEISPILQRLSLLDITASPPAATHNLGSLIDFALEHRLSTYDAAYLHLALRRDLPLATLDTSLHAAAAKLGLTVLPAQN